MEAGAAPYLALEAVFVDIGPAHVLQDVSLSVAAGDLVSLVGPDGAGKSTLLRLLVGLVRPAAGRVVRGLPRDRIGYSGADFDLYPDLTVHENVEFFGRVRGMSREEVRTREQELLPLVGISEARDRLAGSLSGGMKKKLMLAAALLFRPQLLLLDEPTVGVDPVSRRELWDIVAEAGARGTAVVYTTTYLDEAERAQRVLLMAQGRVRGEWSAGNTDWAGGWSAWLVPGAIDRSVVRRNLARLTEPALAHLRADGLVVLAPDADAAARTAHTILGTGSSGAPGAPPALERVTLSLEDMFVLMHLNARPAAGAA